MGKIVFIGAGPGDPGLLTLRAADAIARCDVVLHDEAVHADVLSRAAEGCPRIAVGPEGAAGDAIARAQAGATVGRVVVGDPLFLAVGEAEIEAAAAAGVAFEVIPGVPAIVAAGACAGIALEGAALAVGSDAVRLVSGGESLQDATNALARSVALPSAPAIAIARVSLPSQTSIAGSLGDLAARASALPEGPVLLVVGEAAREARRTRLGWFERRPLFGKRILVTRTREQALSTAALLRERGAEPVSHPTIELHPPTDVAALEAAVARLAEYTYVAFTSANGVDRVWRAIARRGGDARAFGGAKIAAIGPGTAQALEAHGLRADVMAKEFRGEGLADEMLRAMPARGSVLILRAQVARDALPDALRAAGCSVDVVAAYETRAAPVAVAEAIAVELERGALDAATFTSSSTVDNLCDLLGARAPELLARTKVASIGPITTATAERRGVRVDVSARQYTIPGLVDALEEAFSKV
jgi:uroporphyrinogen III methyltransferase/synthase